jgi:hypothetical protein
VNFGFSFVRLRLATCDWFCGGETPNPLAGLITSKSLEPKAGPLAGWSWLLVISAGDTDRFPKIPVLELDSDLTEVELSRDNPPKDDALSINISSVGAVFGVATEVELVANPKAD